MIRAFAANLRPRMPSAGPDHTTGWKQHQGDVQVMTGRAIHKAIDAGAKSIEHGYFASDEASKSMAK